VDPGLLLLIGMFGIMYAVLILPQRRKAREHQNLLRSLAPGDEVITSGGIYGGITEVDGESIYLEVAPDVEVRIARRAVAERVHAAGAAAAGGERGTSAAPDRGDAAEPPEGKKK
jgi:preprotein translocase subunit YajC